MMPSDDGSHVVTQLEELRNVVGELDALAALSLESFDRTDWSGVDPPLVDRTAYMLGMIARSAATAVSKLDGLGAKVADAYPLANSLFDHEGAVLKRLRAACSEATGLPTDYLFFQESYHPDEDPDDAMLRLFKDLQWQTAASDTKVIARMVPRKVDGCRSDDGSHR